jgi:hypothetical protein
MLIAVVIVFRSLARICAGHRAVALVLLSLPNIPYLLSPLRLRTGD